MKTIITQKIDEYNIIIGIGEPQIDSVATNPVMMEALKLTDEYKAVETKKTEMIPIVSAIKQSQANHKSATVMSEKRKYEIEYQKNIESMKELENELSNIAPALLEKQKELILKHAVYFQPAQNEKIITDEEAEKITTEMIKAAENNCYLSDDLKQICDYSGQKAYLKSGGKWIIRDIIKIGDGLKSGEKLIKDLYENELLEINEQFKMERINSLSPADKLKEKESIILSLANQAKDMRSILEIQGDTSALKKSQEWYNSEVAKVEEIYK